MMKTILNLLVLFGLMTLVSCSNKKSVSSDNEVEQSWDDSVSMEDGEGEEAQAEEVAESDEYIEEDQYTDDTIETPAEEDVVAEQTVSEPAPMMNESNSVAMSGIETNYTVKKGDTLMLIAFHLYGDYSKWTDIRDRNPQIGDYQSLKAGMQLKVSQPAEDFSWRPDGLPYLIKRNDTLASISYELYDTPNKWKPIYVHNKPLIKDPNIIYAGFTIYYLEDGNYERQPASN